MTDRVTTDSMLARAVADLEAADAFERLVSAVFEHHQPIGAYFGGARAAHGHEDVPGVREIIAAQFHAALAHYERARPLIRGLRTNGQADLVTHVRGMGKVHPTAEGATLRVALPDAEVGLLVQELLDLAQAPDRAIVVGRHGHRAWLQVLGRPARTELQGYLSVSSDGLVGAAGGILVCNGAPLPIVAECWLRTGEDATERQRQDRDVERQRTA